MKDVISWIVSAWRNYWGNGSFQYLLLAAVIYLIGWKRKKSSVRQVLPYLFAVLFIFICPLTAAVIQKCIGKDVYWRVLWLLPTVPVIALAGAEFPKRPETRFLHSGLAVVFAAAAVVCANSLLHSGNYVRTYNYQKVPDEVANICNLIRENADEGEIRLAADDHIASYVRVYDPSIIMPYGRREQGALDMDSHLLCREINSSRPNYRRIARLAVSKRCGFLSMAVSEDADIGAMEDFGYTLIGTVNQYSIFKRLT